MRHLTCDPSAEVIGQTMLSFIDNLQSDRIMPLLKRHGLDDIQPDQWYPLQDWLEVLNDLAREGDFSSSVVAIGMQITEKMLVPPEVEQLSLGEILEMWNDLYQMQHRGADVGCVRTEKVAPNHYVCTQEVMYPDDMSYGVAYGMARRWLPHGTPFTVKYDDTILNRDNGGPQTVIHVMWE